MQTQSIHIESIDNATETAQLMARGLLTVADADGTHEREAQFMGRCLYRGEPGGEKSWLAGLRDSGPLSPRALEDGLTERAERELFVDLLQGLTYADGLVSAQEQAVIDSYAPVLGLADIGDINWLGPMTVRAGHPLASALPSEVRSGAESVYRTYLEDRNGRLDPIDFTLSKRERFFEALEANPVRWPDPIDMAAFERNQSTWVDEDADPLILLLLVASKVNRVESYAARLAITIGKIDRAGRNSVEAFINSEESYHTRILQQIAKCFGIDLQIETPPLQHRLVARGMLSLPESATVPIILGGEILGTVAFAAMIRKSRELLARHPVVRDRVVSLFQEILTDELGHVAWCRSRLGPAGIRATRALLPVVTRGLVNDFKEVPLLFGKGVLERGVAEFDFNRIRPYCSRTPFWIEPAPAI